MYAYVRFYLENYEGGKSWSENGSVLTHLVLSTVFRFPLRTLLCAGYTVNLKKTTKEKALLAVS